MIEGWFAFQSDQWDIAAQLFKNGLDQTYSNYSEAYSGLGWTFLYKANTLPGDSYFSSRDSLRYMANKNFNNAYEEDAYDNQVWLDVLAGISFMHSYYADSISSLIYNDNGNQNLFNYIESQSIGVIEMSNLLIDLSGDFDYSFQYDPCIDIDNIRVLRARAYLHLTYLQDNETYEDLMIEELNNLDYPTCPNGIISTLDDALICLSQIQLCN